jgi:hypothetical protein
MLHNLSAEKVRCLLAYPSSGHEKTSTTILLATAFVCLAMLQYFLGTLVQIEWYKHRAPDTAPGVVTQSAASGIVSDWKSVHFLVSYQEHGFIKRGLVGSIFKLAHIPPTRENMSAFSAITAALAACLWLAVLGASGRSISRSEKVSVAAILITSPATFSHFGFDAGRFDTLLLAIFLANILLIQKRAWLCVGLASALALLVHEIYLLAFFPLIFCMVMREQGEAVRRIGSVVLPPLAVCLALFLFGGYEQGHEALYKSIYALSPYRDQLRPEVVNDAVSVWSHAVGVAGSDSKILSTNMDTYQIKWLLVSLLPVLAMFASLVIFHLRSKLPISLLTLCPLAPCLLFLVGIDYYRWTAFAWLGIFMAILIERCKNPQTKSAFTLPEVIGHCLFLGFGPLGVTDPLPFLLTMRELYG